MRTERRKARTCPQKPAMPLVRTTRLIYLSSDALSTRHCYSFITSIHLHRYLKLVASSCLLRLERAHFFRRYQPCEHPAKMPSDWARNRRKSQVTLQRMLSLPSQWSRYPAMPDTDRKYRRVLDWTAFRRRYLDNPVATRLTEHEQPCPSCYEHMGVAHAVPVRLPCDGNHVICVECAHQWFSMHKRNGQIQNTCPTCRQPVFEPFNVLEATVEYEINVGGPDWEAADRRLTRLQMWAQDVLERETVRAVELRIERGHRS